MATTSEHPATERAADPMLPIIVAKIHFGTIAVNGYRSLHVGTLSAGRLLSTRGLRVVFAANPTTAELARLFCLKVLLRRKFRVAVFDLILRRPANPRERLLAWLKAIILKTVDMFLLIHKDTRGYQRYFGIAAQRCRYIPFKANNLRFIDRLSPTDGDYIVSCGASHRDFDTLLQAVAPLGYSTVIVLSEHAARAHNARLDASLMGPHVRRLHDVDDPLRFNEIIARARLVVVPILPDTLQPAGISVYLEAMALGKPVIVTRGTSTEGIIDERLAVLVPPGDVAALRSAIRDLWQDDHRRRELGRAGQAFALSLGGNERMVADIARHIAMLCEERP